MRTDYSTMMETSEKAKKIQEIARLMNVAEDYEEKLQETHEKIEKIKDEIDLDKDSYPGSHISVIEKFESKRTNVKSELNLVSPRIKRSVETPEIVPEETPES